jgi:hypothetical protein
VGRQLFPALLDRLGVDQDEGDGSKVTCWFSEPGDNQPVNLAVERNGHANRCRTCFNQTGGYAFDCWTPERGLSRGYAYGRIEDAYYARNVEIRSHNKSYSDRMITCNTVDEFMRLTI